MPEVMKSSTPGITLSTDIRKTGRVDHLEENPRCADAAELAVANSACRYWGRDSAQRGRRSGDRLGQSLNGVGAAAPSDVDVASWCIRKPNVDRLVGPLFSWGPVRWHLPVAIRKPRRRARGQSLTEFLRVHESWHVRHFRPAPAHKIFGPN